MTDEIAEIRPALPLLPVGRVNRIPVSVRRERVNSLGTYEPMPSDVDAAERNLANLWRQDCADHDANTPAIEHNKVLRARLTAIMKLAGIPDSYSERVPSRSQYPKSKRLDAGYLGDLRRSVPIDDGFMSAQISYARLAAEITRARATADEMKRRVERAAAEVVEKRKADMELAGLLVRYGLPVESEWSDILDALRVRDKYLDLALAMEACRGDWSEGCYVVENAMDRFTIQDDRDKEIATDAACAIARFHDDCDGRYFRDTRWGYEALYTIVADQQLVADARRALGGESS